MGLVEVVVKAWYNKFTPITVFGVISAITTMIWFGDAEFLTYTDTHFPLLNLSKYLERMSNVADTAYFPAQYDIRHLFLYPYVSFFLPFTSIWSPSLSSLIQHIILFGVTFFGFISIHRLIREINILRDSKTDLLPLLFVSILYIFNVYAAIVIWRPFSPLMLHYAFFPMFAAFAIRFLRTGKKTNLLWLLVISWLIFPSYNIVPMLFFDIFFIGLIFFSLKNKVNVSWLTLGKRFAPIWIGIFILLIPIAVTTLLNPSIVYFQYERITNIGATTQQLLEFNSPTLDKALFYSGYPPLYRENFAWYSDHMVSFEPILLVMIGGSTILGIFTIARKRISYLLAFPILWLLFILLFTGSNEPLSNIKVAGLEYSYLNILRSVYARFGEYVVLSSLPLIYIGISGISNFMNRHAARSIPGFLILLLLLSSFPILNGNFLDRQGDNVVPSDRMNIPESYKSLLDRSVADDPDFLYLAVPPSDQVRTRSWNDGKDGYIGPDIFPFILSGASVRSGGVHTNIMNLILEGRIGEIQEILRVRYVILTSDQDVLKSIVSYTDYNKLFRKKFSPIHESQDLTIFEFPQNSPAERFFVFDQTSKETRIAREIFYDQLHLVMLDNETLEVTHKRDNLITKIFDVGQLRNTEIVSRIRIVNMTENDWAYPVYIVLPNVTERLYIALHKNPDTKQYDIFTGFWSSADRKWDYKMLHSSFSEEFTFNVNFEEDLLTIEDGSTIARFQLPDDWLGIINSRIPDSVVNTQGEIGVFSTGILQSMIDVDLLRVKIINNEQVSNVQDEEIGKATIINSEKLSPSLWKISVTADRPFILVLPESYDQLWKAEVNGLTYNSVSIFDSINGFKINQTGQMEILVGYQSQASFSLSFVVSMALLIFVGVVIYGADKGGTGTFWRILGRFGSSAGREEKK